MVKAALAFYIYATDLRSGVCGFAADSLNTERIAENYRFLLGLLLGHSGLR